MVKGGHLTATKEETADAEEIARVRKKVWVAAGILAFLGMVVWPLLTLPAGTPWRCELLMC